MAIDQVLPNASRVASPFQLQRDDLRIGLTGAERALPIGPVLVFPNKKPVVTEVAGFESAPSESVVTLMAGFELVESVVTKVAAFASEFWPQLPCLRTTIPAALR